MTTILGLVPVGFQGPADEPPLPYPDPTPPGEPCVGCPNIVFALTDDQDVTLGGWTPMRNTHALIEAKGSLLTRWTIHTPICSPSRSETVSGRYFHNIKSTVAVPPRQELPAATAHVNGTLYDNESFGVFLRAKAGYQVGMFGKSNFNTYQGFDRWFQGAFLGYGGSWEDDEAPDGRYKADKTEYATALIGSAARPEARLGGGTAGHQHLHRLRAALEESLQPRSCPRESAQPP